MRGRNFSTPEPEVVPSRAQRRKLEPLGVREPKTRTLWRSKSENTNPLAPRAEKLEPSGARGQETRTLWCPRSKNSNPQTPSKQNNQATEDLRRISIGYPEVKAICFDFKFPGRGQRDTPVTDAKGIVEIIMLQTTERTARVRRQATELLCWYVGVIWPFLIKCAGFAASRRNWRQ